MPTTLCRQVSLSALGGLTGPQRDDVISQCVREDVERVVEEFRRSLNVSTYAPPGEYAIQYTIGPGLGDPHRSGDHAEQAMMAHVVQAATVASPRYDARPRRLPSPFYSTWEAMYQCGHIKPEPQFEEC